MSSSSFPVRKAAVLGAGVMGAQIAAHLVNAGVPVDPVRPRRRRRATPTASCSKALAGLAKLEPAPLATADRVAYIDVANYDRDLARLAECDLVIEAIAERMDWKRDLYAKIGPHLAPHAIVASNTSGLSINALAEALPAAIRAALLRHPLLQSAALHAPGRADRADGRPIRRCSTRSRRSSSRRSARAWSARRTRRTSSPTASASSRCWRRWRTPRRSGLGFDVVDALTGPAIGRAKSATYRTGRRRRPRHDGARDQDDARHAARRSVAPALPRAAGARGPGRAGRARAEDEGRVLPQGRQGHRGARSGRARLPEVGRASSTPRWPRSSRIKHPGEKFAKLRAHPHPQAQFLWAIFRDLFHYCAYHLAAIADNARDVDLALRWGFGWAMGPFEIWQAAGWKDVAGWLAEDIAAGKTLAKVPLPSWVTAGPAAAGVHTPAGACSASANAFRPRSTLPVYRASACSRIPCWARRGPPARRSWRRPRCACGTWATTSAIVSFKIEGEHDRRGRARRHARRRSSAPSATARRSCSGRRGSRSRSARTCVDRLRRVRAGQWSVDRGRRRQVPADLDRAALQPRADRRRGARHGARRLVRIHPALRPHGRRARVLHRAGRGGRRACCRAAAAARSSRCARRRKWRAARRQPARPAAVPAHVLPDDRDGEGLAERRRGEGDGIPAAMPIRSCSTRSSSCTSRGRRRARWPRPATGRRCRRATSRSPAAPASRRSR